jgi:hypothetical protein
MPSLACHYRSGLLLTGQLMTAGLQTYTDTPICHPARRSAEATSLFCRDYWWDWDSQQAKMAAMVLGYNPGSVSVCSSDDNMSTAQYIAIF